MRILGIGRNEYIATMVQVGGRVRMIGLSLLATRWQVHLCAIACLWCIDQTLQPSSWCSELCIICCCNPQAKSKKLMWRMNKGIVKDLLPQAPLPPQIGGCDPLVCGVLRGLCALPQAPLGCVGQLHSPLAHVGHLCLAWSCPAQKPLPWPILFSYHVPVLLSQTPGGWCTWST